MQVCRLQLLSCEIAQVSLLPLTTGGITKFFVSMGTMWHHSVASDWPNGSSRPVNKSACCLGEWTLLRSELSQGSAATPKLASSCFHHEVSSLFNSGKSSSVNHPCLVSVQNGLGISCNKALSKNLGILVLLPKFEAVALTVAKLQTSETWWCVL